MTLRYMINDVVSVKNFSMKFARITVIDNLSFVVKKGKTFGFHGSSGSGKTTTINCYFVSNGRNHHGGSYKIVPF